MNKRTGVNCEYVIIISSQKYCQRFEVNLRRNWRNFPKKEKEKWSVKTHAIYLDAKWIEINCWLGTLFHFEFNELIYSVRFCNAFYFCLKLNKFWCTLTSRKKEKEREREGSDPTVLLFFVCEKRKISEAILQMKWRLFNHKKLYQIIALNLVECSCGSLSHYNTIAKQQENETNERRTKKNICRMKLRIKTGSKWLELYPHKSHNG